MDKQPAIDRTIANLRRLNRQLLRLKIEQGAARFPFPELASRALETDVQVLNQMSLEEIHAALLRARRAQRLARKQGSWRYSRPLTISILQALREIRQIRSG